MKHDAVHLLDTNHRIVLEDGIERLMRPYDNSMYLRDNPCDCMSEWWADLGFWVQLIGVLTPIVLLSIFLWRWTRRHDVEHHAFALLPDKVDKMSSKIDDLNLKVGTLMGIELERTPALYEKVKAYSPVARNPYDPSRKARLLDKMKDGTIGLQEAKDLEVMLNEDLVRARGEGAAAGAGVLLAILAALGALAAVIYLLTRED